MSYDPENHDGVITHQTSWSMKSLGLRRHHYSEGDGIPAKLFKIVKDDAVKVLY